MPLPPLPLVTVDLSASLASLDDVHTAYLIARIRDLTARTLKREPIDFMGAPLPRSDERYFAAAVGMLTVLADAAADTLERELSAKKAVTA